MPVKTVIDSPAKLQSILQENDGWIVLKFSAVWCGPCKKIAPIFSPWFTALQYRVNFYLLDIDECFEIYGFLSSKKRVNGVPAILAWKKGNVGIVPDLFYSGTDPQQINALFTTIQTSL